MNTLEKLYDISYNENINIFNYKWKDKKARIINKDNAYYIGIDYAKIDTNKEEKEIMAEELGHYYCNALYPFTASQELIKKCEWRALKWAYSILVPYNKLKEKISEGLNVYELAEEFDVDVKYMINCIDFYIEKYGDFK